MTLEKTYIDVIRRYEGRGLRNPHPLRDHKWERFCSELNKEKLRPLGRQGQQFCVTADRWWIIESVNPTTQHRDDTKLLLDSLILVETCQLRVKVKYVIIYTGFYVWWVIESKFYVIN